MKVGSRQIGPHACPITADHRTIENYTSAKEIRRREIDLTPVQWTPTLAQRQETIAQLRITPVQTEPAVAE